MHDYSGKTDVNRLRSYSWPRLQYCGVRRIDNPNEVPLFERPKNINFDVASPVALNSPVMPYAFVFEDPQFIDDF